MELISASDPLFGASAPPPSQSSDNNSDDAQQSALANRLREYRRRILLIAQNAVYDIDGQQATGENPPELGTAAQYRNALGLIVKSSFDQVVTALQKNKLHLRIVISQGDTLLSVKNQISNHRAVFEHMGYPAWSKDILGATREYKKHSWCQLVFQGALTSAAQSMRSDFMHLYTAYTDVQRALDIGAIEDLEDYIRVLKLLGQMSERVKRYGMCSTEYQVTVRAGFKGRDRKVITAAPEGCRMSDADPNSFESIGRNADELVVWPSPASGRCLPIQDPIVKPKVAKEVAASKFRHLHLRDLEDLGMHKLEDGDLKLLLNTQRFANAAQLLANKFYFGNHVTDGFMSNLARQWLLGSGEQNEDALKHLRLLPERTSIALVRVMMTAVDLGSEDQLRSLCLEISRDKEVFTCCEAIASSSVPSESASRPRLCLACLEPAFFKAIRRATDIITHNGRTGRGLVDDGQDSEELKILLGLAKTDTWRLSFRAYLQLKELGSTNHSAEIHAEQVSSYDDAQKLEELIRSLNNSSMRRQIVNASRSLQDLEHYVKLLTGQMGDITTHKRFLLRLLGTAGYRSVAQVHVPFDSGSERQNVAAWMSSGPSEGVCTLGEIFLQDDLENPKPPRDGALLRALTGEARLASDGRFEFLQGFHTDTSETASYFLGFQYATEKKTQTYPVWKNILAIDSKARSHEHLSEQIYFHMDGGELPKVSGLSLVTLEREGTGRLAGHGLTITRRIAKDIWHLGGDVYYSMKKGRLFRIKMEGNWYYAEKVEKVTGRFTEMRRGGLENKTIS